MNSEFSIAPVADANANTQTETETTIQAEIATRPEHIPEKFWDAENGQPRVEDLVKSYRELESKLGSRDPANKPSDLKIEKAEGGEDGETEIQNDGPLPLTSAVETFASKYEADPSSVGEEDIKSLVDLGLPQAVVETYLAGLQALQSQSMNGLYDLAGGQEKLETALAWAGQNLSDDEIERFNAQISDQKTSKMSIEWLMAKYNATSPAPASEGKLLSGSGNSHGDVYASRAEMHYDMSKPEYRNDPAFQAKVAAKVAASMKAGTFS